MKRSKFSLSHHKLFSCNMGQLVPIGLTEVLPGDSFQHSTAALVRVAPLLAPVMHPVEVAIHHWYVPHRLVWEDFEDFITGGPDGMDDSVFPTITLTYGAGPPATGNNTVGSLADYLGVPPENNNLEVSALPFRAYSLIFNEWYRDQDLVTPLVIDETSGPDTTTNTTLQYRAWEKDYFTSARPFTQKGPTVSIPLTGDAPISGLGVATGSTRTAGPFPVKTSVGTETYTDGGFISNAAGQELRMRSDASNIPDVYADLSNVSAASINDLRLAFALQRYEEARARYGSRYTEYLRYLGVRSSDARLQRPEYLGGGKNTIQFSEVLQTAPSADDGVVGTLKGHGIGAMRSNRYRRFFEEHGYVVSLLSARPRTMYTQGLPRTWNRRVKEDFWQQELQHVGQQEVYNRELFVGAGGTPGGVFGYQDRYDEYRRMESSIAGEMRTTLADYWHMARIFASQPTLNADFVTSNPTDRIYAVTEELANQLYIMARHSIQARRLVARTGTSYIF